MLTIAAAATREALPFPALIEALHAMFRSGCEVPARQVHAVAPAGGSPVTSLVMAAWNERYYGVKIVNIAPANAAAQGLPGLHSSYLLHDARTGVPLALIDGDQITARRTAAASALGGRFLAREDARRLLVVGAGKVARLLPAAWRAVRPIERVTVWARSLPRAEALAGELRGEGFDALASPDLAAAVAAADVISCATLATAPVLQGRWLQPGSHLDLIGSFTPAMREADDDCFAGAAIFVDTAEALTKSGDLTGPLARGVFAAGEVRATLAELARGERPGRQSPHERTVFKSVGTALEDLAAAVRVYETVTRPGQPASTRRIASP